MSCLRSKETNGLHIFINVEKYSPVVFITLMFLCFNIKVSFLIYKAATTMTGKYSLHVSLSRLYFM